ncbi:MAG: NUDIX hydrolase [Acidobacteriota bacterium]|nr:NUDIX hydrolase [Acidobacteriota bacterium]
MEIDYRFCPTCAGPLESRLLKPGDPERLVCTRCGQVIYLDPKVAVGTIIRTDDDRLVMVRRAIEPGYGLWVFPGGYVDRGEEVTAAAIREAREEAGIDVRLEKLVNIYSYARRSLIVLVYAGRMVGGELCTDEECLEARLFHPDELPWDQLAFDSTSRGLRDYLSGATGHSLD